MCDLTFLIMYLILMAFYSTEKELYLDSTLNRIFSGNRARRRLRRNFSHLLSWSHRLMREYGTMWLLSELIHLNSRQTISSDEEQQPAQSTSPAPIVRTTGKMVVRGFGILKTPKQPLDKIGVPSAPKYVSVLLPFGLQLRYLAVI